MNNSEKLKRIEAANARFQEAMVEFINELLAVCPESQEMVLDCFNKQIAFGTNMLRHLAKFLILK